MRIDNGGYRRDYLRALAQRIDVDAKEVRIMGSKSEFLRTLVATPSAKTAGLAGIRISDLAFGVQWSGIWSDGNDRLA